MKLSIPVLLISALIIGSHVHANCTIPEGKYFFNLVEHAPQRMHRPSTFNMTLHASSKNGIKLIFIYCDGSCSEEYWIYKPETYQISQTAQPQSFKCLRETGEYTIDLGNQGLTDGNVANSYRRLRGSLNLVFNADQDLVGLYNIDLLHDDNYWQTHFHFSLDLIALYGEKSN